MILSRDLEGLSRRELRRVCCLEAIASHGNLFNAAARARRGKSRRPDVEEWWMRRETEIASLRDEILSNSWQPSPFRFFTIFEPKRREIAAAPFRDRVVHHALCNLLAPILERRFIPRSFSCQLGKGTTAARECCRVLVQRHRYVLKCDVQKFFPSIDHAILRHRLSDWVDCPGVLRMIDVILGSYLTGPAILSASFPGDDLFSRIRPRGLPIGNLTSQLWGNFYLDEMDHWMVETERQGAYLRYTDDFLVFANDKERLWELHRGIVVQLTQLRLTLAEPKSRLLSTAEGVPFCGFRFFPNLSPRVLGSTKRRFERRRRRLLYQGDLLRLTASVFAWYQFSREGNTEGLRRAWASHM